MKLLYLLLALFSYNFSSAQLTQLDKPRNLTKKELAQDDKNHNCSYNNTYSPIQRRGRYPFSTAAEIRIVSFQRSDSVIAGGELPKSNGRVDLSKLKESKTISGLQVDSLTDLMYHWRFGGPFYSFSKINCYSPRNAILFLDGTGNVFEFIELCFECEGHRLSSHKVQAGDFCDQKYDLLKTFFLSNGILFGTRELEHTDKEQ